MSEKYTLDKLKAQEIKEMIVNGKIKLENLDTSALEKLLDYETEMLCIEEGDMELINACTARLDELNGPLMSEEQFRTVIERAGKERVSAEKETASAGAPVSAPAKTVKRRLISKKIWIIAAAIALLAMTATVTASAFGFNVFDYFREVIGLSAGASVEKGTITLINNGNKEEYTSIDDLVSSQNIDILFPDLLPAKVTIENVCISKNTSGGQFIEFITNDPCTYISVDTSIDASLVTEHTEKLVIGDYTYYIFGNENFAICYYNNCYYYVSSDNNENLLLIIKNMREN